jgi:hypothetical protein
MSDGRREGIPAAAVPATGPIKGTIATEEQAVLHEEDVEWHTDNGTRRADLDRLTLPVGRLETAGPAEIAAARIDWAAWLRSLSRRQ